MTDPLAVALDNVTGSYEVVSGANDTLADAIRAALPPDAHLFTVDSLAAAIHATDHVAPKMAVCYRCRDAAAAIIAAAKEAERE